MSHISRHLRMVMPIRCVQQTQYHQLNYIMMHASVIGYGSLPAHKASLYTFYSCMLTVAVTNWLLF